MTNAFVIFCDSPDLTDMVCEMEEVTARAQQLTIDFKDIVNRFEWKEREARTAGNKSRADAIKVFLKSVDEGIKNGP